MNCDTGEITNNRQLIEEWRRAGAAVLELPDLSPESVAYYTEPVATEAPPKSDLELERGDVLRELHRHRNTSLLRALAGRR